MVAFHSFWSAPNSVRNRGRIDFPDFELLTAILSALTWQAHSGTIKMITDTPGASFFRENGLSELWDEMDTSLDRVGHEVDPILFWAAGKLFALKQMDTPCVMLDTDLIVWRKPEIPDWADVDAAHPEPLHPHIYPPHANFHLKDGYTFPKGWDFGLYAANTAFLYLRNADFRDRYVDAAISFITHVEMEGLNPVTAMCFAEQRILPMIAEEEKQRLGFLLDMQRLNGQDLMTHTWGFKQILRTQPAARYEFCMRMVKRIAEDFPKKAACLEKSPLLEHYYRDYLARRA